MPYAYKIIPEVTTIRFCITDEYKNCPFYRVIKRIKPTCEMISICPMYKALSVKDFDKFLEITGKYCLTDNNVNCERFKIKKPGGKPPDDLLPDGSKFESTD